MEITEPDTARRFAAKVDSSSGPDGCHLWTGAKTGDGYGQFGLNLKTVYAHRIALATKLGRELAPGEMALHTCDNPSCVNPKHLYPGDQKQNMRDCAERGRLNTDGLALGRRPGATLGKYRVGPEICGSVRGYSRHLRHGEPTCAECRAAISAYHRERAGR